VAVGAEMEGVEAGAATEGDGNVPLGKTGPASVCASLRQWVSDKRTNLIDSARFMALVSVAESDAFIAVFDANYAYAFRAALSKDGRRAQASDTGGDAGCDRNRSRLYATRRDRR
jgi:hypothetical protein